MVLTIFIISTHAKAAADPGASSDSAGSISLTASTDTGLEALLPDIGTIYRQAFAAPYQQVETEITDPSIAAFFSKLMADTGLDKVALP